MVYHIPFAIICAKPEELRQFNQEFEDSGFVKVRGDRRLDQVYEIPGGKRSVNGDATSQHDRVIITSCSLMGHMSAAIRTLQILNAHQPEVIIFAGTAASMRPDKIQVGDVVVPRKAINRYYDKISEKGQDDYENLAKDGNFKEFFFETNAMVAETVIEVCSDDALAAMSAINTKKAGLVSGNEEIEIDVGGKKIKLRAPQVIEDVDVFSCGMVVDSVSYRTFLSELTDRNMRKVGVIDMESQGFFAAIKAMKARSPGTLAEGLMVRGISDYAGRKQQTETLPREWKDVAVRNAAKVTRLLLQGLADRQSH